MQVGAEQEPHTLLLLPAACSPGCLSTVPGKGKSLMYSHGEKALEFHQSVRASTQRKSSRSREEQRAPQSRRKGELGGAGSATVCGRYRVARGGQVTSFPASPLGWILCRPPGAPAPTQFPLRTYQEHEDDGALVDVVHQVTRLLAKPAPAKTGWLWMAAGLCQGDHSQLGTSSSSSLALPEPHLQGCPFPEGPRPTDHPGQAQSCLLLQVVGLISPARLRESPESPPQSPTPLQTAGTGMGTQEHRNGELGSP